MRSVLIKYKPELIGVAIGAVAGWFYWFFIGCSTGTCAITSSPVNSALYGALLGWFIGGMFNPADQKKKETHE